MAGRERPWAVIAGGGTGGHVVPAIAIGRALSARGHDPSRLVFVGSRRGIEGRLVPEAGFPLVVLPGRGLARRASLDTLRASAGLALAVGRALVLIGRWRPRVVISVGGYASVPASVAAAVWRVPLVVAEQNAVPGLANRLAGRWAAACAVSFPGTPLPRSYLTGNPVRPEVAEAAAGGPGPARAALGLDPEAAVVAVAGGSLGALRLNRAVADLAHRWADRAGTVVYHVVGRRDWGQGLVTPPPSRPGGLVYRMVEFEDRMPLLLAAADVFVGRSGASTVAELTVAGVPSVLVPLPGAPGDHQTANARRLAEAGAAVVVPDAELDARRLAEVLEPHLASPGQRLEMAAAARRLGRPDAAARVAELAEAHARA
jgi:undecaprenyldiphospho-muramoylpentapeptide beta-N-acetylglucosaminyltransferase